MRWRGVEPRWRRGITNFKLNRELPFVRESLPRELTRRSMDSMASLSRSTLTRDGAFELPSLPGLKFTPKVR